MAAPRNLKGRIFEPGKPLPKLMREEILHLYNHGYSKSEISSNIKVSKRSVTNIINHFQRFGTVAPFACGGSEASKVTENVLQCIEIWKIMKPSIYAREIQDRLILEGVCNMNTVPSVTAINEGLSRKLGMTKKKIHQTPLEYYNNIEKVDEYLELSSRLNPSTIHFFDESSVIKTTSNRLYGTSYKGQRAIEVQRYASNATYTVNLLHSIFGVDYYNILIGASNGEELISFFDYALDCKRSNGLPVFIEGDTVVMDNCGFHHGHITETVLRDMLEERGVSLLFQPPYSPHLNTCEYCFHQMKQSLREDEHFSEKNTEMAIMNAVNGITASQSLNYFHHCGYYI